jgi:glucose-6-phosphate 1-dehydrogenase
MAGEGGPVGAATIEQWRIMQPLLEARPAVQPDAPGSWGPEADDKLVAAHGGWHGPWVAK